MMDGERFKAINRPLSVVDSSARLGGCVAGNVFFYIGGEVAPGEVSGMRHKKGDILLVVENDTFSVLRVGSERVLESIALKGTEKEA